MISFVNGYRVVLDACVLAPMPVCAVLLKLAQEPAMYAPYWSECILTEVAQTLAKPSFALTPVQIERRLNYMRSHFEEALVVGYKELIPSMRCHNDDRHVLAAAVRCEADAIVTNNMKDFPEDALADFGIEPMDVDTFLLHQFTLNSTLVAEKLADLAAIRDWGFKNMLRRLSLVAPRFVQAITQP